MPVHIYWKFYHEKNENFQIKKSDILHIPAQNIDCGYSLELPQWGSSNVFPQSMFLSRNKKNNVYHCKPQFYYIKVGFKGDKIILACFCYVWLQTNDALVAPLLRLKDNKVHVDEAERSLKKKEKFSELIILYEKKGLHEKGKT